jgi:lysine 2-monooxygenase
MDRGRRLSRRAALGALAATPILSKRVASATADEIGLNQVREAIDVAVVGSGVSGTYCCWRLQNSQAGRQAVLFEMSDRIGGRLLSIDLSSKGLPNVFGELGGMRFLSSQVMVTKLVDTLGLQVSDFPVAGPNNFATLRGVLLRSDDFKHPDRVPYRLLPGEEGLSPGELLVKAITTVIPSATSLTPQQWEYVKQTQTWNGEHLYNWGLWNVLLSTNRAARGNPPVLSSEAYALLYDGGGYQSLVDNWNCAEAFEYLLVDFPSSAQYLRLTKGYQRLPETLAEQFKKSGGKINMQHRLVRFAPRNTNGILSVDLDIHDHRTDSMRYYNARALILAMPQRSLELLSQHTPVLNDRSIQDLLKSVMRMPAYKAIVTFPTPWWHKCNVAAGRSTTDLPLRQVYYMETATAPADNTTSLMLATYADGRTEPFWRPLVLDNEVYPIRANPFAFDMAQDLKDAPPASTKFTQTVHRMLGQMHQLQPGDIPEIQFPSVKDWAADPYGGGWHFWRPNIKVWEILPRMRQPIDQTPVYICGEAYANQQGWVEGALTSAEHVLQDHFRLNRPYWLPGDYYIGP